MLIESTKKLGVGINYRTGFAEDIVRNLNHFDFIEVGTERFFIDSIDNDLDKIANSLPIVLHGLTLSLGASQPVSAVYLDKLKQTLDKVKCEWFSEHIALTSINGLEVRSLMPVEFNEESVERVVNKVKQVMRVTSKPFLLENITYYYTMPNSEMNESQFICNIIEKSDCGLLLDLNNLYVNSVNHRYDPYDFLQKLPLDRVVEVHLAGCDYIHDMLIDTHASHTKKEVLSIFEYVCSKTEIKGVVIERDDKLDEFSMLIDEVNLVRNILNRVTKRRG